MISLESLEQKRISYRNQHFLWSTIAVLSGIAFFFHLVSNIFLYIGLLVLLLFSGIQIHRYTKIMTSKEEYTLLMTLIISVWGNNIEYRPAQGYTREQIKSLHLFEYLDREQNINSRITHDSFDLVVGTWNEIDFSIADLRMEYSEQSTTTDTSSRFEYGKNTVPQEIFNGLLICAHYPFDFEGETWVQPRSKRFAPHLGESVRLESSEFEAIYATYSTNQMGARMALQTDIMSQIIDLVHSQTFGIPRFLFTKNQVWIAIPTSQKWLDITIFSPISQQLQNTEKLLQAISTVMINLKLNAMGNRVD